MRIISAAETTSIIKFGNRDFLQGAPHQHYVAKECGITDLFGIKLHQLAKALISIAHPYHKEMLEKATFER